MHLIGGIHKNGVVLICFVKIEVVEEGVLDRQAKASACQVALSEVRIWNGVYLVRIEVVLSFVVDERVGVIGAPGRGS